MGPHGLGLCPLANVGPLKAFREGLFVSIGEDLSGNNVQKGLGEVRKRRSCWKEVVGWWPWWRV